MTKHTLKQFVGHFVGLGLKELTMVSQKKNKKRGQGRPCNVFLTTSTWIFVGCTYFDLIFKFWKLYIFMEFGRNSYTLEPNEDKL